MVKARIIVLLAVGLCLWSQDLRAGKKADINLAGKKLDAGEIAEAREIIERAAADPALAGNDKMWRVRGDIHADLFIQIVSLATESDARSADYARIALESYSRVADLRRHEEEIRSKVTTLRDFALNEGVRHFKRRNFAPALEQFRTAIAGDEFLGEPDGLALFNAGLAAEGVGAVDDAIDYHRQSRRFGFQGKKNCSVAIHLLRQEGREDEVAAELEQCRAQYPADAELRTMEINARLSAGENAKARELLGQALADDPDNPALHLSMGTAAMGEGDAADAEAALRKAVELRPGYFDAHYNLGALYFNAGVELENSASTLEGAEEEAALAAAGEQYAKALPSLEAARTARPGDRSTLMSLMQLYARLDETEKYLEVEAAIAALE